MSAAWVAGSVRARAIARRRLGQAGVRELATAASYADAVQRLDVSPYGQRVHIDDPLPVAVRGVAMTLLWNLRVLAGWLPATGAEMLRALGGWFEIANVEEHLHALAGRPAPAPFPLGTLGLAWPRIAASSDREELRNALAASAWGDPGGTSPRDIQLWLRLAWAERAAARVPPARSWALGAVALLLARERFARRQPLPERAGTAADRLVGTAWSTATTVGELAQRLPAPARWALADVTRADQLWQAELRWWHRVRSDSSRLLARSGFGADRIVGAVGLLAVDARSVAAALEIAARGREAWGLVDALA